MAKASGRESDPLAGFQFAIEVGGMVTGYFTEVSGVGSEHEVIVHDMHQHEIASRAAQHGVRSVPAVVINGKLAGCCAGRGVEENVLREALR